MCRKWLLKIILIGCFCVTVTVGIWIYEQLSYDLPSSSQLETIIVENPKYKNAKIVNRFNRKDMVYMVITLDSQCYVVAFTRSPIFSRYDSEYQVISIDRSISNGIICLYLPSLFSHDFELLPLTNENFENATHSATCYLMLVMSDNSIDESPAQPVNSQARVILKQIYPHLVFMLSSALLWAIVYILSARKKKH